MSAHTHDAHDHGTHGHHITPIIEYVKVFGILLIFMVLTIAWAIFALQYPKGWGPFNSAQFSMLNNFIAMGIAIIKAIFVINIFMGIKFASNLVKTYAILGFVWFTLMLTVFADYGTRRWEPVRGWTADAPQAMPRANEPYELGMPERSKIVIPEHKKEGEYKEGTH
jgi:caa(3)-type oxidase subunit IV